MTRLIISRIYLADALQVQFHRLHSGIVFHYFGTMLNILYSTCEDVIPVPGAKKDREQVRTIYSTWTINFKRQLTMKTISLPHTAPFMVISPQTDCLSYGYEREDSNNALWRKRADAAQQKESRSGLDRCSSFFEKHSAIPGLSHFDLPINIIRLHQSFLL